MVSGPESDFTTWVDNGQIVCRSPEGLEARIELGALESVWFQTEAGPWGIDWWVLRSRDGEELAFPLGANGEASVLERLKQLQGFVVDGMNATEQARFCCWEASRT